MMTFKKAALCISAAFFLTTSFAHANNTATSKPTTKAQLSKTNAIAKPKPPSKADYLAAKIKPGAITLMSNTTALLKSLIQYQELGFGLETRRLYMGLYRELWRKTSISAPNISPHKLLPLLPTMLKPLGIDLNKPFGIYAWAANYRPILTFVVNTDKAVFLENLKKSGLNPHFVKHHGVDILVLGEKTRSTPLGVFHGSTFTFAFKNVPRRMAVYSNQGLLDLFSVVGKPANSPYAFIKASGKASLLNKLKARTIDHFLFVPNHNLFKRFRGMKMISGFLKQFALSYSLKDGAKLTLQLRGSSLVKTFLQPFQPPKGAKSWLGNIPQNAAWVSQAYLNVGKLLQLISNIGKMGILPPRGNMQLQMVTAMLNMQASGMGVNLDKWKKLMTGRIVTGMLWDKSSIERIKRGPNALFRGHLRGVFVALELADEAGAKAYFKQLQGVVTKLKSLGLKEFNALQVGKQTIDKKEVFSLAMPGVAPIYMTTHKNGVFILGHRATLDQFIAGWKGASLAELAKTPAYKQLTSLPAHFTWIQPAILREVVGSMPNSGFKRRAAMWINKIAGISLTSTYNGSQISSSTNVKLQKTNIQDTVPTVKTKPAPVTLVKGARNMSRYAVIASLAAAPLSSPALGVLAAVAIPAFNRFTKRSKTSEAKINIKAISYGAVAYFDAEHSDSNGDPMPKQFPGRGKGWICTPKARPCAKGKAKYPRNYSAWNQTPWKELRFAVGRKHYYQYCYKSEGTGVKSKFWVRAIGDLDCDGKTSLYEARGSINSATGEVERTNTIVMNGLE